MGGILYRLLRGAADITFNSQAVLGIPANITTVSDTQINVIAPDTGVDCLLGCTVVVQTTQGTSTANFTITIN
jgi:uncharacterized protein (TIGR03437 family)